MGFLLGTGTLFRKHCPGLQGQSPSLSVLEIREEGRDQILLVASVCARSGQVRQKGPRSSKSLTHKKQAEHHTSKLTSTAQAGEMS